MERYICIHGHFYQPPRENAWLEHVETQDSAYPYHDWNQRVTAECYGPNGAARIMDKAGYVTEFVNNYSLISFDFGPTLLSWLERNDPEIYQAVIASDQESRVRFSGHGSALAHPYDHIIMPLASRRDKETEVRWGVYDFEHRFGRLPEGMWLPETAVDLETLETVAASGIRFIILAPHQAKRIRRQQASDWKDVPHATIDITEPYELRLASGRRLAVFFYNGAIAHDVAFNQLLENGEDFARRLADAFPEKRASAALVHIATDGETYGHHRRFAEMALAFALRYIESHNLARLTNYAEFLGKHPPVYGVEINENTSWSCDHGLERWRSDDGCNAGRNPKWNQAWRAPLRETMDWLRDSLAPRYETAAAEMLKDPWAARDDYISVILDRTPENVSRFLEKHQAHALSETEIIRTLKLMEMARHALLMYTSDGWFFDELSGVETVQVIQYAARAAQLAKELLGGVEEDFLNHIARAKSNITERGDGRRIYEEMVKPLMVSPTRVAAHFAVAQSAEDSAPHSRVYCYNAAIDDVKTLQAGDSRLLVGKGRINSTITQETLSFSFGGLRQGNEVTAGAGDYQVKLEDILKELEPAFAAADFTRIRSLIARYFGVPCSLSDLLSDDRRQIMGSILKASLEGVRNAYRQVFRPPLRPLAETEGPIPKHHRQIAECLLNDDLRRALSGPVDAERIRYLLEEAHQWQVDLDSDTLSHRLQVTLETMVTRLTKSPGDMALAVELTKVLEILPIMPFSVDLWKVQSLYHRLSKSAYQDLTVRAGAGDQAAQEQVRILAILGERLKVRAG
jgi:alpha-amylase/alpha-mannosidase (GH57 family)